jgi:hypothetical protein
MDFIKFNLLLLILLFKSELKTNVFKSFVNINKSFVVNSKFLLLLILLLLLLKFSLSSSF